MQELRRFYAADVQHLRGLLGDPLKDWDADFATFRPPVLLRPRYVVSWRPGGSESAESEASLELVERRRRSPSPTSSDVSVPHRLSIVENSRERAPQKGAWQIPCPASKTLTRRS